jgi:hypothetical protein
LCVFVWVQQHISYLSPTQHILLCVCVGAAAHIIPIPDAVYPAVHPIGFKASCVCVCLCVCVCVFARGGGGGGEEIGGTCPPKARTPTRTRPTEDARQAGAGADIHRRHRPAPAHKNRQRLSADAPFSAKPDSAEFQHRPSLGPRAESLQAHDLVEHLLIQGRHPTAHGTIAAAVTAQSRRRATASPEQGSRRAPRRAAPRRAAQFADPPISLALRGSATGPRHAGARLARRPGT